MLWATAQEKGYKSGTWATYKQWQELGAQVRKGEKSANVVFRKFFEKGEAAAYSDEENCSFRAQEIISSSSELVSIGTSRTRLNIISFQ